MATPSPLARVRELQPFLGVTAGPMTLIVVAAALAGFAEGAVLAVVVHVASVLESADRSLKFGPIALGSVATPTLLWIALGLALARLALQFVGAYLPARIGADVQARLRSQVFAAFTRTSWDVQAQEREGELQDILTTQVNRATMLVQTAGNGLGSFFMFAALLGSALLLNRAAAGLVILAAGVLFFALRPLSRVARRASTSQSQANMAFAQGVSEAVRLSEEAQVFGVQPAQRAMIDALSDEVRRPYFRGQLLSRSVVPVYQGVTVLLLVGAIALLYAVDATGLASLGAVVLILLRAMGHSQNVQSTYHAVVEILPYVETVRTTVERYEAAAADPGAAPITTVGRVELRDVSFAYVPGRPVLRDVSIAIAAGESVGIVGPSGAGKSTFVQLLLRLRAPSTGELLLDGRPLRELSREDWQRRVTYVPQDSRLIDGTVAENIRFHRDELTDADLEQAARLAHIHDEIESWPLGYGTHIGQRADAVSGGQRQRLCLARALAGRPDLLVLDEPTSALDLASELAVQRSLQELRGQVTLVIVAHRLSTLQICDRLLVFEDGRLSAAGSPSALASVDGFYREALTLTRSGADLI